IFTEFTSKGEDALDYIVVLGAKVRGNGTPTKPLYWRIDAAEEYLNTNENTIAILSGGKGSDEPISEAECMYNVLVSRGIDKDRLILEDMSTNTNENIRFSLKLMNDRATFGVVTNNFHVFRAVNIARTVSGREVSGIAAEYKDALWVHYMAREAVGIFKDTLFGNMSF
nr:YdcF family protein [Clostridia bacterium]